MDYSTSWSRSDAIVATRRGPDTWEVAVTVYNLGDVDGYASVDVIVWYVDGAGERVAVPLPVSRNLPVPATPPGLAPQRVTTRAVGFRSPAAFAITHLHAIAYDPVFDPLDSVAKRLLQDAADNTVDYSYHAARRSRQVGCRTVLNGVAAPFEVRRSGMYDLLKVNSLIEVAVPDGSRSPAKRSLVVGTSGGPAVTKPVFEDVRSASPQDFPVVAANVGELEIAISDEQNQPVANLRAFDRTPLDAQPDTPPQMGYVVSAKWVRHTPSPGDRDLTVYLIHR